MKNILLSFLLTAGLLIAGCNKSTTEPEQQQVSQIEIAENKIQLRLGETQKIMVRHSPVELDAPDYVWTSSNEDIVSVADGEIVAKALGEATISAQVKGEELKASVEVQVLPIDAELLTLTAEQEELREGESVTISYSIEPANTTGIADKVIEWTSSDETVATIKDGVLTAHRVGDVTITAKIKGTETLGTISFKVLAIDAESIILKATNRELSVGDKQVVEYSIEPANTTGAADKEIVWKSSNEGVASVKDGVVTARGAGVVTITATIKGTDISGVLEFKVSAVLAESITILAPSKEVLAFTTMQLRTEIGPSNTTDKNKLALEWSLSDKDFGTIDSYGLFNAKNGKLGDVTVTVKIKGTDISDKVVLKVTEVPMQGIELGHNHLRLFLMPQSRFKIPGFKVIPENTTFPYVNMTSSPTGIVNSYSTGELTPLKVGKTTVTFTAGNNPSIKKSVTVEVVDLKEWVDVKLDKKGFTYDSNGYGTGIGKLTVTNRYSEPIYFTEYSVAIWSSGQIAYRETKMVGNMYPFWKIKIEPNQTLDFMMDISKSLEGEKAEHWLFFSGEGYGFQNLRLKH